MKTKKFLFYLLAVLLGGCIPVMSLHPLYNKEDVVFEKNLLGIWVDDANETTWEFKCPDESKKAYGLVFCDEEDKKGSFVVHLVKLKNRLFLDVYPSQLPCAKPDPNEDWVYNIFFLVPVHTFIKIESIEPQLKMRLTDDDEMEKLLKEDPNVVKHEVVEDYDGGIVLTGSTKELQAFVLKYADDKRVFTKETVLDRKETQDPNAPDCMERNETEPTSIAPNKG